MAQSSKLAVAGLLAVQLVALLMVAVGTLPAVGKWHAQDLSLYYEASQELFRGRLPYRDFALEYPPLALLPFALPRLLVFGAELEFDGYIWLFLAEGAIFSTVIALVIARIRAPAAAPALAVYALLVALTAPLLPWRYDLFPALLTVLALLCVLRERPGWAGVCLGLGIAAKLYPVVLLAVFGVYYIASQNRPALRRLALGGAGALAATLLPFLLLAPGPLLSFLRYHGLRGLQLESLPAGLIVLAQVLGLSPARLEFNYGAMHVVSPLAGAVLTLLPILFLLLFGLVLAGAMARWRQEHASEGRVADESLIAFSVAALLAFIVTNKVFSPQYLIWLLPFAPLLPLRQAGLLVVICALTIVLFPFNYQHLMKLEPLPVLLLNLRNLLTVALLAWILVDRAPRAWRSALART